MNGILNWMKEFLIIYLILAILTHLAAADQYKKYLRFFSGIILLLALISPALRLFGEDSRLDALVTYETFWEELDSAREGSRRLEFLRGDRSVQKYEQAIAKDIKRQAAEQGTAAGQVRVVLSDDYEIRRVEVQLVHAKEAEASDGKDDREDKEDKKKLAEFLMRAYGLDESRIFIE